jgi:hypothetical protein
MKLLASFMMAVVLCAQLPETQEEIKARDKRNSEALKSMEKDGSSCSWDQRMEHSNVVCIAATAWDMDIGAPWKPEPEIKLATALQIIDRYARIHGIVLTKLRTELKKASK